MNLLELQDASLVEKTNLTRKLTLGGVTKAYPVYRVRLDLLYYNDQNDRIATWVSEYNSAQGADLLALGLAHARTVVNDLVDRGFMYARHIGDLFECH